MGPSIFRSGSYVILCLLLVSITLTGCMDGDKDEEGGDTTGALPPGSPPDWQTGFGGLVNETTFSADSLMAHSKSVGIEPARRTLSFTNKAGITVSAEYAGYELFDLFLSLGLDSAAGEVRFTASDNYSITVNIVDLYLEGENGRALLALATDGEWLEKPMLAGERLVSQYWIKNLASITVEEWKVKFTGMLNETGSIGVTEMENNFPICQFDATVLHHGDQIMGGEFRGTCVGDILGSLGVGENATKVLFHAADTEERITLSLSDIVHNSQSTNPIVLAWEMDGSSIPLEDGGPVRLVPPDDNVGDIGDFPSHYWWKWVVEVEVG